MLPTNNSAPHKSKGFEKEEQSLKNQIILCKQVISVALKNSDIQQAVNAVQKLNRQFPHSFDSWMTTVELALHINNPTVALQALECASKTQGDNNTLILFKCKALHQANKRLKARELLSTIKPAELFLAAHCQDFGHIAQLLEYHSLAVEYFNRGYQLASDSHDLCYNLATSYRFLGQLDDAQLWLNKAITLNPNDAQAYHLRSSLQKQTRHNNWVEEIRVRLQQNNNTNTQNTYWYYAIAKELEDLQQYDEAFKALEAGATLKRRSLNYDIRQDAILHSNLQNHFPHQIFMHSTQNQNNFSPIFILGLPRVGSTLVEQILLSDKNLLSAGEIEVIGKTFMQALQNANGDINKVNFKQVGREYIDTVSTQLLGSHQRFIDKLPLNYLNIGIIALALPRSKIVCVERDPMDTCYAIYKTLFEDGYPFSYSLKEIGQYYLMYQKLINHWREVLPGRIHFLKYEALIKQPEATTQALFQYCELPWSADCLNYHQQNRVSTTASSSQIRQPIYQSSVNKWTHYQHQLTPLESILKNNS